MDYPVQGNAPNTADAFVPHSLNSSGNAVPAGAYVSTASFPRTADANAYSANDVVGAATGITAALTFAGIGPAVGGEVIITTAQLEIDVASVPSGMTSFRLYLYSGAPPSALGDNAAWDLPAGDRNSFLGYVDLGTPVDLGSTLYVETLQINKQLTVPSGGAVRAYLVTIGGYTPGSGDVFRINLHGVGV